MNRRNPPSSSTSDVPPLEDAFEAGTTTLDLDDISEEELDSLYFDDVDGCRFNLYTVSGLSLILAGIVYLLTELGLDSVAPLGLNAIVPWLVGAFAILLGAGLLARRSSRSSPASSEMNLPPMTPDLDPADDHEQSAASTRLTRSRTDKKLLGVCGGLANYLNLDPTLLRIAFVIGTFFFGSLLLAYLGLAFAMPKAPSTSNSPPPRPSRLK